MTADRDDNGPRSVVAKVLSILNAFGPSMPEMTLNELAVSAGLPISTTYRLASRLVELGALEHGTKVGYRIGTRLWETGSLAPRIVTLRDVAVPFMQDLYEATHDNVHLAVRQDFEVLYVEKVAGRTSVTIKSQEARRLPLHATGVGKVLLAYAPDPLFRQVVERGLTRYTPHTIVTPGRLQQALDRIRETGISYSHEELTLGTVSVAAPVEDAEGTVVAALSIVARSSDGGLQRMGPAVRTAALGISRCNRERAVHLSANDRTALAPSVTPTATP